MIAGLVLMALAQPTTVTREAPSNRPTVPGVSFRCPMILASGSYATLVGTVPTFEAGWNASDRRGFEVTGNGPDWVRGRHSASLVTYNAGHRRYLISIVDPETADASYSFDVILLPDGAKGIGVLRHVGPHVSGQDPVRTSRLIATSYCDSDWTAAKGLSNDRPVP